MIMSFAFFLCGACSEVSTPLPGHGAPGPQKRFNVGVFGTSLWLLWPLQDQAGRRGGSWLIWLTGEAHESFTPRAAHLICSPTARAHSSWQAKQSLILFLVTTLLFVLWFNLHTIKFSGFAELYSHHHCWILKHFITPKISSVPINRYSPFSSPGTQWATVCMNLPLLYISYK